MNPNVSPPARPKRPEDRVPIAIACGGTGGHLFPGIAVAEELMLRHCSVTLLISPKEVDQQAVKSAAGMNIVTLPAVGLARGKMIRFLAGFWKSFRQARKVFGENRPDAVLAMGGFTSAPPVFAGRSMGAKTFLHESNTIPGRANRWLSRFVDESFVYFPETAPRLNGNPAHLVGMPVRSQFTSIDAASARMSLGLRANQPMLLVMGGSQGASGINDLVIRALPEIVRHAPELQFLHLTGLNDVEKVRAAYAAQQCHALVQPFLTEMELALGAATLAISRAGASSLAELAATGTPSILIPYPHAADNHQSYNAAAFARVGAARMIEQEVATPELLAQWIGELLGNEQPRDEMRKALEKWHSPDAAVKVAEQILAALGHSQATGDNDECRRTNGKTDSNETRPVFRLQPVLDRLKPGHQQSATALVK